MGFSKNGEKDEIDTQSDADNKQRVIIEAHAVCSKPVSELILRMLRSKKQAYSFQGIADKSAYMDIKSNGKQYRLFVDLVSKDYIINMEPFEKARNKEYLFMQMGKMILYAETIFKILMANVSKNYPESIDWKLQLDKERSTMYIDVDHSKRIGFVVQILKDPPKESAPAESSTSSQESEKKQEIIQS